MGLRVLTLVALAMLIARMVWVTRGNAPQADREVTVEMSVWGMPFENTLYTQVYIPEFEKENPGIRVKFDHFEDYFDRVLLSHAGGIAPDVIRESYSSQQAWTRRGLNLPLDRFIDGPDGIDRRDFIPVLWDGLHYKGETFGVPQDINLIGLYYNKSLFDKAGLSYPNASWTWRDLKNAVDKLTLTGKDGRITQKGIDMAWSGDTFLPFLFEAGGQMWKGDRVAFDSPEAAEALRFYRSLMKSYSLSRSTTERGGLRPDKFFQNGTVAMLLDGSWETPAITKGAPDLRFGAAPLPRDLRATTVSGSCVWGIDRNTKHPEAAWKLVKFLSSEWALKKYWQVLWVAPPARWSALRSPEFHDILGIPGAVPAVTGAKEFQDKCGWVSDVLDHGWTTLQDSSPYKDRAMTRLDKAVDEVLIQNRDPAQALHQAAQEANEDIAEAERSDAR